VGQLAAALVSTGLFMQLLIVRIFWVCPIFRGLLTQHLNSSSKLGIIEHQYSILRRHAQRCRSAVYHGPDPAILRVDRTLVSITYRKSKMAIEHAALGEVVDLGTFGPENTDTHTVALVKTDQFEAIRMFVRAGTTVPPHKVNGPITVQCLRGEAAFFVGSEPRDLKPGTWLHIEGGKEHAIEAKTDCVLLVTIIFVNE
jgi:quercetin dioxygenase-like cupin family protein